MTDSSGNTNIRDEIRAIENQIEELRLKRKPLIREYIKEYSNYIYISDHALVRYMERVKKMKLKGESDNEKIGNHREIAERIRKEILSQDEQKHILNHFITNYHRGDYYYIIKSLTMITVIAK